MCAGQDGKSKHEIRSKCEELSSAQARTVGRAEHTSRMSRVPGQVQVHTRHTTTAGSSEAARVRPHRSQSGLSASGHPTTFTTPAYFLKP